MKDTTAPEFYSKRKVSKEKYENFDLSKHLISFLWNEPFYSRILRSLTKIETEDIDTAGVIANDDDITLWWNRNFLASLNKLQVRGLLKHECLHIVFEHTTSRRKTPHIVWNYATDLAINSTIPRIELPDKGLVPGEQFTPLTELEREELPDDVIKRYERLSNLIASFEPNRTSEYYYEKLMEDEEVQKMVSESEGGNSNCVYGVGFDDHEKWDELTDGQREMVREKIKEIVVDAAKECDTKHWGSVSASMISQIRKIISNEVKWQSILRRFCGYTNRNDRYSTNKRLSRKYPGLHPGISKSYKPNIAVYVDESGSVGKGDLEKMYAELNVLSSKTNFYLYKFDADVDEKNGFLWKKGKKLNLTRTLSGGTSFCSVVDHVEKSGKLFDAYIIMTDGYAEIPRSIKKRRCWILLPNTNDKLESQVKKYKDIVVQMK